MLAITHDLSLARRMDRRAVMMRQGRILASGATAALFRAPVQPYTADLLTTAISVAKSVLAAK